MKRKIIDLVHSYFKYPLPKEFLTELQARPGAAYVEYTLIIVIYQNWSRKGQPCKTRSGPGIDTIFVKVNNFNYNSK